MNQILVTENHNSNNKKSDKTIKHNGPADIKKIMVFFACSIIIFGIALTGVGSYKIYANNKAAKNAAVPSIVIAEVDGKVSIKATYSKGISKIVYYWNEANQTVHSLDGKISWEGLAAIPSVGNVIYVQLVGSDGITKNASQTFSDLLPDTGTTTIAIDLSADGSQILVSAKNGAGLQYLTYKLNNGQETRADAANGNSTEIDVSINISNLPIQVGQNTLYVTAVDMSGNSTDSSKPITGQNLPVINVVHNGDVLNCTITHDVGFSKIEFNLNGQDIVYDQNSSQYSTSNKFSTNIPLQPGDNKLTITATGLDGKIGTYRGETTY